MKISLVILIVLAIIFVVNIWLGFHQGGSTENPDQVEADLKQGKHPLIQEIGSLLSSGSPELKTAGGGCVSFKNHALTMNQTPCTMVAAPARTRMLVVPAPEYRNVKFQIVRGNVSFTRDELNKPASPPLWRPGDEVSLVVGGQNGNRLTLDCLSPGSCQVRFK